MQIYSDLASFISIACLSANGRAILVGGCVRDAILGKTPKDIDIEVFGIEEDRIESVLSTIKPNVSFKRVGRSFPVWKVWTDSEANAVDVSLPRRERKTGDKHTDFEAVADPFMSFLEAASRRDYTINAMGFDLLKNELLDPFLGEKDLKTGILRHTSERFVEDPLRVLRGAQFCARFELTPAPETLELCRTLKPDSLSRERIWEEWGKLILKGAKPSLGIRFLQSVGWLPKELAALDGIKQDQEYHPEGDVLTHVCHCMDAFAETRTGDENEDLIVGLAVLLHDCGKATTTEFIDGRWRAHGHEAAGKEPVASFLSQMTNENGLIEEVTALVVNHMRPTFLWKEATKGETVKAMNRSVRRLAREVKLGRLARVVYCDKAGRPPKPKVSPEAEWLKQKSEELGVVTAPPKPLLMGRHLIALGAVPGFGFRQILEAAMSKQLDGDLTTEQEAVEFAKLALTSGQIGG